MNLLNYRNNVHSQNGEDGVLREIFKKLGDKLPDEKWCVEFGAWDGKHLSNTFRLVENGWNAIYIEGNRERYAELLKTSSQYPNISCINEMVGHKVDDQNRLDILLSNTSIPADYELLSIDIDSYDLAVWSTYTGTPKVVVIEINSSLMPGVLQWHDGGKLVGNSFSSTLNVAKRKGYELACHTGNLIFVRADLVELLNLPPEVLQHPETLFIPNWLPSTQGDSLPIVGAKKILPDSLKAMIRRVLR